MNPWSIAAINKGKNLSSLCTASDTNPNPAVNLCSDYDGNQRPNPNCTVTGCDPSATDPWDIGAYFYVPYANRPVPGGPVAYGQSLYVTTGTSLNITLTANSPSGDPLSYNLIQGQGPSNGTLTGTAPNIVYTPKPSATSDSFVFQVTDTSSAGKYSGVKSNQAPVNITVNNISISVATTNGTTNFNTGSNIPLTATVSLVQGSDPNASIGSVSFYGSLNCSTSTAPTPIGTGTAGAHNTYTATWSNVSNGSYCLTAKATESAPNSDPNNGQIAAATINIVVSSAPPDVVSGLVGYWNFNEGSAMTAHDCSAFTGSYIQTGNTNCAGLNPGALNNLSSWGSVPGALQFTSGQNQSVSTGTSGISKEKSPITVSAWVYTASSSETGQIISRMDDGYKYVAWFLQFQGANDLVFYDRVPNGYLYEDDPGISITPNAWHHVAVTYDGSSYTVMNIYIDGALKSSAMSELPNEGNFDNLYAPTTTTIGGGTSAAISDVRVYNRVLAPQDINELYSMGRAVTYNLGVSVTTTGNASGTITSTPAGINCGSTCTAIPFNAGAVVTLTAQPAPGSAVSWPFNCAPVAGISNQCTITMNSNQTVMANFTTVPVLGSGDVSGNGPVTMYDAALALIDYAAGGGCASTAITAQPTGACARAGMDPQGTIGSVDSADVIDIAKNAMGL